MPELKFYDNGAISYRAGKFVYFSEGNTVLVTKDTANGLFINVGFYEYKNRDAARDAAYGMASKQAKA